MAPTISQPKRGRNPSRAQVLLAKAQGKAKVTTVEDIEDIRGTVMFDGAAGIVEHTGPQPIYMYEPMLVHGAPHNQPGYRQLVPAESLGQLMANGWTPDCPHCGEMDCAGAPRFCNAFEKPKFVRCPICRKPIPDRISNFDTEVRAEEEEDENEIVLATPTTPTERLRGYLGQHMLTYHPAEASAYGYRPSDPNNPLLGAPAPAVRDDRATV